VSSKTNGQNVTGGVVGGDYNSGPYIVTFTAGQTRAPFNVPINDDNICEGNEVFDVTINPSSTPSFVAVGSPDQATVTIEDDECKQLLYQDVGYAIITFYI